VFVEASDSHGDGELSDAVLSLGHQPNAIAIGIDHRLRFPQALSADDPFAIAARRRLRQGIRVMVELNDRALLVVPILLLTSADR